MSVKSQFDELWEGQDATFIGKIIFDIDRERALEPLKFMSRDTTILDVGCGVGYTLEKMRDEAFHNSVGIDNSPNSIKRCKARGFTNKDVSLKDIRDVRKKYDVVFSEGLLEHYEDIQPMVDAFCRASKKWVITTVPNMESLYWCVTIPLYKMLGIRHIYHYNHSFGTYVRAFKKRGFRLFAWRHMAFNAGWIFMFERCEK